MAARPISLLVGKHLEKTNNLEGVTAKQFVKVINVKHFIATHKIVIITIVSLFMFSLLKFLSNE